MLYYFIIRRKYKQEDTFKNFISKCRYKINERKNEILYSGLGMKKVQKLLKGHHYICFLDFEGTQFSHEMIAIGACLATLDRKGNIKRLKENFKIYVRAKNRIGNYVTNLTGITEEKLQKEGVSFYKAMSELRNYCGSAFKKCSFITFGNHDYRILNQSISYNLDTPKEIVSIIQHNYVDFSALISEFIRDDNNNPYSLLNYCKLFNVTEEGEAHDPASDALNLAHLYNAFLNNEEIVLREYLKLLSKPHHLPLPIAEAATKLANGEDFTAEEFKALAKKVIE